MLLPGDVLLPRVVKRFLWELFLKEDGSKPRASQAEIFPLCLRDWEGDKARLEMLRLAGRAAAAIKMLASCKLGFAVGLY